MAKNLRRATKTATDMNIGADFAQQEEIMGDSVMEQEIGTEGGKPDFPNDLEEGGAVVLNADEEVRLKNLREMAEGYTFLKEDAEKKKDIAAKMQYMEKLDAVMKEITALTAPKKGGYTFTTFTEEDAERLKTHIAICVAFGEYTDKDGNKRGCTVYNLKDRLYKLTDVLYSTKTIDAVLSQSPVTYKLNPVARKTTKGEEYFEYYSLSNIATIIQGNLAFNKEKSEEYKRKQQNK